MPKTHLVIPDSHSHPGYSNERFDWLSKLIQDVKPDVVINIGDHWDMESLSSYDRGKLQFEGRRIKADIAHGIEANDRIWGPLKKLKKKMPRRVFIHGNHENRLPKFVSDHPELYGMFSNGDFDLGTYYQDVVEYEGGTPGVIGIDGIAYSHYFISGVKQQPVGGENPGVAVLNKHYTSCTFGHIHVLDWGIRTDVYGKKMAGLCAGVFQDYTSGWAGEANHLWWRGCVIKRDVRDGFYDPQFVSIDALRKEYG